MAICICNNCITLTWLDMNLKSLFLKDIDLCEYPGVDDSWMEVISSQGSSLLSADLSGSDVTDCGLVHIKDCENIQALNFSFCDQISDSGLDLISGIYLFLRLFCFIISSSLY